MRDAADRSRRRVALSLLLVVAVSVVGAMPREAMHKHPSVSAVPETLTLSAATLLRGGFVNFQLSPHCMRAIVMAAVACSQVGPAGLAGCGVALHMTQGACP